MQGRACSFDLLRNPALEQLILVDADAKALAATAKFLGSKKVRAVRSDLSDATKVKKLAAGCDVVVSCVPYFLNLKLAQAAIAAKAHWVDLGGNTEIVLEELKLSEKAKKA